MPITCIIENLVQQNLITITKLLTELKIKPPKSFINLNPLNKPITLENLDDIENKLMLCSSIIYIPKEIFECIYKAQKYHRYLKKAIESCKKQPVKEIFQMENWQRKLFICKVPQNICDSFFKYVPKSRYENVDFFDSQLIFLWCLKFNN